MAAGNVSENALHMPWLSNFKAQSLGGYFIRRTEILAQS